MPNWNPESDPVLTTLRRHLQRRGTFAIALDVDDVLADTTKTRFGIMAEHHGLPARTTVEQLFTRHHWVEDVARWQTAAGRAEMDDLRNSVSHHAGLPPLPGSVDGVADLSQIVAVGIYITHRRTDMQSSTRSWISNQGFPKAPVMCRPHNVADGTNADWKTEALAYLAPYVIGIVDDNPGLLNTVSWDYPGHVYTFGERAPFATVTHPAARTTVIWSDVCQAVRRDLTLHHPAGPGADGQALA